MEHIRLTCPDGLRHAIKFAKSLGMDDAASITLDRAPFVPPFPKELLPAVGRLQNTFIRSDDPVRPVSRATLPVIECAKLYLSQKSLVLPTDDVRIARSS